MKLLRYGPPGQENPGLLDRDAKIRDLSGPVHDAPRHIAGYCVVNDVSEREFQLERGGQWTKGKSCDTFCPMGPWVVTADEVPDPGKLQLWTEVNGERRQNSNTSDLIFGIDHIVSYVSHFMTLYPR